jgi:hypothetical protein
LAWEKEVVKVAEPLFVVPVPSLVAPLKNVTMLPLEMGKLDVIAAVKVTV